MNSTDIQTSPTRYRWLKRAGIATGLFALVLVVLLLVIQSRAEKLVLRAINSQLTVKVEVREITFSVFRSFPNARLDFHDVMIPTAGYPDKPLLKASKLTAQFSLVDLIRKEYSIRYLELRDGALHIIIPQEGSPNYMIFKETDQDHPGEAVEFALRKVRFRNIEAGYYDNGIRTTLAILCKRTFFRGDFSASKYGLKVGGEVQLLRFETSGERFFTGQHAVLDFVMDADNLTGRYELRRGKLDIEGLPFRVSGLIVHNTSQQEVSLAVEGDRMKIDHLLDLLPEGFSFPEGEYQTNGHVVFQGQVVGSYAGGNVPEVSFGFGIDGGVIRHLPSRIRMDEIYLSGQYHYSASSSQILIKEVRSSLGTGLIKGEALLVNLGDQKISGNLEADLLLEELLGFYPVKGIGDGRGRVKLYLRAETAYSLTDSFSLSGLMQSRANGEVVLSGASFLLTSSGRSFSALEARLIFDNNDVRVSGLTGMAGDNSLSFTGYFRNLFPYLLTKRELLEFKGEVHSPSLDVKALLFGASSQEREGGGGRVTLPERIAGTLDIQADKLSYDGFTPSDVTGRLRIGSGQLLAEQVKMKAFDGEIDGAVALVMNGDGSFLFDCVLNTDQADIRQLFYQFNNFGQEDITYRNLEGFLSSKLRIRSTLSPQLAFQLPTLEAVGELMLEQGALVGYEPVQALARYTRLDDLSDIRFSTLRNEIRIANREIVIPEMMIRSDAVDLSFSGKHTFDGLISYQVRILLSELLTRKARQVSAAAPDADLSHYDDRGRLTLHLLISGTTSDPVVRYDRRGHRARIRDEVRSEREEVKALFQKEFGTFNLEKRRGKREVTPADDGAIRIIWEDEE